jgi:carbamoylphosphate synthase small subunit
MENAKSPLHGALFWMDSLGADGLSVGEVMLNHEQVHHLSFLLDPRFAVQTIAFTYPRS